MPRFISLFAALGFLTVGACESPTCGPGTKQVQAPDGTVQCVSADAPSSSIGCDVDGGDVEIVAGSCHSRVTCDPATTMFDPATGVCTGTGGGSACPACPNPSAGKTCLTGSLIDLISGQPVTNNVRVAVYDPLAFLSNPQIQPLAEDTTTKGCFTFADVPVPGTGLIAIGTSDPANTSPQVLQLTAAAGAVVAGRIYHTDTFVTAHSVVTNWTTNVGGAIDFDAQGAYVAMFYDQAVPDPTQLVFANEKNPLAGVTLLDAGQPAAGAHYFGASRMAIDPTAMATTANGGGLAPADPAGLTVYSGMGGTCASGTCTWEKHQGATVPHLVFVERFHNCALSPGAATCM
jgi:hypothetical protein